MDFQNNLRQTTQLSDLIDQIIDVLINKSYGRALKSLQLETLFSRREKLCKKFAKKCKMNSKFSKWFKPKTRKFPTRGIPPKKICEVDARLDRFKKSPINFLTKLLNNM